MIKARPVEVNCMSGDFALSQGNLNLGEKSEENEMLGKCEVIIFSRSFL